MSNLRIPKAWSLKAKLTKEVKAGIDMSAETVNNMRDPSNGEPMETVQMYCLNGDGSRDLIHVAANRNSRIVLPLPNAVLDKIGSPTPDDGTRAAEVAAAQAMRDIGNPFI